jgi:hypothetical protein
MSDKEETFVEALEQFYKLKNMYDTKINRQKDKILKNNKLSKREKRDQYNKMLQNSKCVKCNKPGGTNFSMKQNILKASCGTIKPCKLNIELDRGMVTTYEELTNIYKDEEKNYIKQLLLTKLDLLFGYTTEDEAVDKFKILRNELAPINEKYIQYHTKYLDILFNTKNQALLKEVDINLYIGIQKMKKLMKEYQETGDTNSINNILELYESEILHLVKNIRDLKYEFSAVEYDINNNTYHLIEEPYTLQTMETFVPGNEAKIISNKR